MIKQISQIQTKILLLIIGMGAVFAIGLGFELQEQIELERQMLIERQEEKAELVREIVRQKSDALAMFTSDYSRWDDMVGLATSVPLDSQFARENLDVALDQFEVQSVLALNRHFDVIYSAHSPGKQLIGGDSVIAGICRQYLPAEPFRHFFIDQPLGVLELCTAPIQPTVDTERKTTPQGYLVVGYLWSDSMLQWLSRRTGTTTNLVQADQTPVTGAAPTLGENGALISQQVLHAADSTPVAILESHYSSEVFTTHLAMVRRQVMVLAIFGALVIAVLFVALYGWVSRPLDLISSSLKQESGEPLLALTLREDEFGQIARLMHSFFEQKLALVEEIVERRQAERNAHESQRALRSFIANLTGMAYRCRHDVNRTADYVSDGCLPITGFSTPRFTETDHLVTLNSLIHPDDRETARATIDDAVSARKPYRLTYRIVTADHTERYVLDHGRAVYDPNGHAAVLEGIMLDITDRVTAEHERAALQAKLGRTERVQALGLLAGGVAHDLNNMLAPVLAYPDLILMKLADNDPIRPKINIIKDAAQQAVDVVQDLLTMARRGRYEMAPVDLNAVVERYLQSANFLHLTAKHPAIHMQLELDRCLEPITGSPIHLNKAIMNIVINAFDAMPKGGTLSIRTGQREVSALADGHRIIPGDYVVLSVSDTGVGIAAEDMKKIFEPYFSRKLMGTSGTGLGLAVVYGTVKDHHGYYDIESAVGKGTTFTLYFPASSQDRTLERTEDFPSVQSGSLKTQVT